MLNLELWGRGQATRRHGTGTASDRTAGFIQRCKKIKSRQKYIGFTRASIQFFFYFFMPFCSILAAQHQLSSVQAFLQVPERTAYRQSTQGA